MTKKQMELRILELEKNVATLAEKENAHATDNSTKTSEVAISVKKVAFDVAINSECLDEVAEIITENDENNQMVSECLDETAECISELYERIEALEEILNGGK